MALLMAAGSESVIEREREDLDAIVAYKESPASEFKERGNKYVKMGKKHYSDAWVVYKGVLENRMVEAVKKLEDVKHGREELLGEVSVIGRIYHMNLVRMWGFCSENSHRHLVCEFAENGSLENSLFDPKNLLGWKERFQIVVGMASKLAYQHHERLE